jgi:hypothetical protein
MFLSLDDWGLTLLPFGHSSEWRSLHSDVRKYFTVPRRSYNSGYFKFVSAARLARCGDCASLAALCRRELLHA